MAPQTLTVLAAIRSGEEERLREDLRRIGDDIQGTRRQDTSVRIEFTRSRHIHFARFAILTDPDRGADRMRLLYSANFDGDLDSHLAELVAITSDVDAIWGRCEAYTGVDDFPRFIRAHANEPAAFYIAFREETVAALQDITPARRRARTAAIAAPNTIPANRSAGSDHWRRMTAFVKRDRTGTSSRVRSLHCDPEVRVLERLSRRAAHHRQPRPLSAVPLVEPADRQPSAAAKVALLERVARQLHRAGAARARRRSAVGPGPSDTADLQGGRDRAEPAHARHGRDAGTGRPRPCRDGGDRFVREAAVAARFAHRHQHDSLRQVARHRRRPPLMMVSDYDGSWESYIDEFAEMILSGLDAIWETSYGYPPDGARDLPAFKRFLRSHQVPAEIFFSAYPEETVLNIVNDRAFAQRVRRRRRRSAARPAPAGVMSAAAATRLPDDVLADIQGFITSGYGHLSYAAYLFVQFQDAGQARRWLGLMAPAITSAKAWPTTRGRREG